MTEPILVTPYKLASRYLTIAELPGNDDHPLIQWWLMNAGMGRNQHDETSWCGAFVANVAWELWMPRPVFPARARSWLTIGRPVPLDQAQVGFDIVVLSRGEGLQPGPEVILAPGHVGFFAGLDGDSVKLLGGNQSNKVSVAPFSTKRVLGVRRWGTV